MERKRCPRCKSSIASNHIKCPICFEVLPGASEKINPRELTDSQKMAGKLLGIVAIVVILAFVGFIALMIWVLSQGF